MSDVLEEHEGPVNIAGRTIPNLRFADDINGLTGSEQELIERLDQTSNLTAWRSMPKKEN